MDQQGKATKPAPQDIQLSTIGFCRAMALAEDALSTDCKCSCIPASLQKSELLLYWKQMFSIWVFFFVTAGVTYHTPPVLLPAIMQEFLGRQTEAFGASFSAFPAMVHS